MHWEDCMLYRVRRVRVVCKQLFHTPVSLTDHSNLSPADNSSFELLVLASILEVRHLLIEKTLDGLSIL